MSRIYNHSPEKKRFQENHPDLGVLGILLVENSFVDYDPLLLRAKNRSIQYLNLFSMYSTLVSFSLHVSI